MNLDKVIFGFFIVLALTLNFGFCLGDIDNPSHHHVYELFATIVVNLVATILKFGDRSQMGAALLATSFVADLQLFAAAIMWGYSAHISMTFGQEGVMAGIVSLASGALLANVISVTILVIEVVMLRR
ncbi:conserved hypothetical protein [Magnetococcus marinus MC-1]|uniref:Uncharacterized protein n=1 Tax=Magnetococcus marinus (strain ATCC BAA-1437 / JCM 17883 / MC-1) TaxID=156889 RepID=A0LA64_MAGMM|nr:DUF6394 family protein [Magnetococcus marinus]ABK44857.1 conserved hypothetical protein [Magnetococcus marinus MC-1]